MTIQLTSAAFPAGGRIPKRHTCEADDLSPPLAWEGAPPRTKAFVLLCDDPDAPGKTWVHWVLYDLPGETRSLVEGIPAMDSLPGGGKQGRNDFGRIGYGGPCPPKGHGTHHYSFRIHALDEPLRIPSGAKKAEIERAMAGHVLAQGELVGTYSR